MLFDCSYPFFSNIRLCVNILLFLEVLRVMIDAEPLLAFKEERLHI
jgi:hypothetical protein